MSPANTLEALVLDVFPYRDNDLMGRFFSPDAGSFSAMAYGARKSNRRFPSGLDHLTVVELVWKKTPNRPVVVQSAEVKEVFWNIREDFDRTCTASFLCELLKNAHLDRTESRLLYPRVVEFLREFDAAKETHFKLAAAWILTTMLGSLRLVDLPATCVSCGDRRPMNEGAFDADSGQFACSKHASPTSARISREALLVLQLSSVTASLSDFLTQAKGLSEETLVDGSAALLGTLAPFLEKDFGRLKTLSYLL